jgi:hypothetical protein
MISKPTVTATGIPPAISRELVCELIQTLGIDPEVIRSLEFHYDCIRAEIPAFDTDGREIVDGHTMVSHQIVIPIVDGMEQPPA